MFSFHAPPEFFGGGNIRSSASHDPLGALGDLGTCNIRYCLHYFVYIINFHLINIPVCLNRLVLHSIGPYCFLAWQGYYRYGCGKFQ